MSACQFCDNENKQIMKIKLLSILVLAVVFASCTKESVTPQTEVPVEKAGRVISKRLGAGYSLATTYDLIAGQNINVGNVTVYNSATEIYVEYNVTAPGWSLTQTHVYVGDPTAYPKTPNNAPQIGNFPYGDETLVAGTTFASYVVPMGAYSIGDSVMVAAHGVVVNGTGSETAWSAGRRFATNWFTYSTYGIAPLVEPTDDGEGCSLSQGYWFANSNNGRVWPASLTVGGHAYTESQAVAIWTASGRGVNQNTKHALTQVGAILLSGSSVLPNAQVWSDVNMVNAYLATLPKLSPTYLPALPANINQAAGRIGAWISENHCD